MPSEPPGASLLAKYHEIAPLGRKTKELLKKLGSVKIDNYMSSCLKSLMRDDPIVRIVAAWTTKTIELRFVALLAIRVFAIRL